MKRTKIGCLAAALLGLSGCMREPSSDDCPAEPHNLILHLAYHDAQGRNLFADRINSATLLIFDGEGRFCETLTAETEKLAGEYTLYHRLEPGIYHIIGWGNMAGNTEMTVRVPDMFLEEVILRHRSEGTDSLYYAPAKEDLRSTDYEYYRVEVPQTGVREHTLEFVSAYHILNVFLKGVNEGSDPQDKPRVILSDVSSAYDIHLVPSGSTTAFTKVTGTVEIKSEELPAVGFRIPHFDRENPILVHVQDASGKGLFDPVSLEKFLRDEGLEIRDGERQVINMMLEQLNGEIVVTFIDWSSGDYRPVM